jgi:hypothetical protein
MRATRLLFVSTIAAFVVTACIGGPGNAGEVSLRNESSESVEVTIDQTSNHGIIGGTDHIVLTVPPWQEGWCYALGAGLYAGPVTISVSGPSVPFPISTTVTVPATPPTHMIGLVDSTGTVRFADGTPPPEKGPCDGYGQVEPTASP